MKLETSTRPLLATWLVLMILLALSVGSAWLRLGPFNVVINLGIAGVKALLVMMVFMRLSRSGALIRLFAFGVFLWLVAMIALALTDAATQPR